MKGVEVGGNVLVFGGEADNPCETVLDVLQAGKLVGWEIDIKRVTVVEFGMDQRVGYCFGSRKVDGGADTPEVSDVPVACFANGCDLRSKGKVRVEYETEVAGVTNRLDSSSRVEDEVRAVNFRELDRISKYEEFSFGGVEGEEVSRHPVGNLRD